MNKHDTPRGVKGKMEQCNVPSTVLGRVGGAKAISCNPAKNCLACSIWAKERAGVNTSCGIERNLQYDNTFFGGEK